MPLPLWPSCSLSLLVLSHKMIRIVKSTAWKVVHRKNIQIPGTSNQYNVAIA
jgi:hypothetical protein